MIFEQGEKEMKMGVVDRIQKSGNMSIDVESTKRLKQLDAKLSESICSELMNGQNNGHNSFTFFMK